MSHSVTVRPVQQIPQHLSGVDTISTNRRHRVRFRHPAYTEGKNVLLLLLAPDHPCGGIHHETARVACAIIAGNRWDGYFTETIDGARITSEPDSVLLKSDYFFHVTHPPEAEHSSQRYQYPVVASFDEWHFPHENLPPMWSNVLESDSSPSSTIVRSNLSVAITLRDGTCRMSGHEEGCEIAHLCPPSEDRWFHANEMYRYIYDVRRSGAGAVNDISNAMLLRSDLHTAFDQTKFAFLPKASLSISQAFVVHLLAPSAELGRLYHNTQLHSVSGISREFLFARFAWSIFPLLEGFLHDGIPRELLSVSLTDSGSPYTASAEECRLFTRLPGLRSTSASPKKRSRADVGLEGEEEIEANAASNKRLRLDASFLSTDYALSALPTQCRAQLGPTSSCTLTTSASGIEPCQPYIPPFHCTTSRRQVSPKMDTLIQAKKSSCESPNEEDTILRLREQYLEYERARSDPDGAWFVEQEWILQAATKPLSPKSVWRYFEGMGAEVFDHLADV